MSKKQEKEEQLEVVDRLNKKYGAGTIIGGKDTPERVEIIKTGSLTLDIATGIGGNPIGKLIEMYGPESSGKSTLTLHFMAEFQKQEKRCVLIDHEHSFDRNYAKAIGVDIDTLKISQPESMEDGYNIIEELIKSGDFGLIVLDSHTSMIPKKALDSEIGDAKIALQARLNSEALLKIHPLLSRHNCTMISIAQLRTNIGGYGNPNVPSGGNAYKYYSDMRYRVSKVLDKDSHLNKTEVEVIKNKCAPPFGKAEFPILWGLGIDRGQEIIDLAVKYKILIKGGGGWYQIDDATKVQGDEKLKQYMKENPGYAAMIESKVFEILSK